MNDDRYEALRVNIESLHSSVHELWEASQRRDSIVDKILEATKQDGENIRALARIAEIHERRLTELEGGEDENK